MPSPLQTKILTFPSTTRSHTHFNHPGSVRNGLIYHPNGRFLIYPLGDCCCKGCDDKRFLAFSRSLERHLGSFLVLERKICMFGQRTHHGFLADVILWDLTTLSLKYRMQLHKVCVEDIAFNNDDTMVATLEDETTVRTLLLLIVSNFHNSLYKYYRTHHRLGCQDWKTHS